MHSGIFKTALLGCALAVLLASGAQAKFKLLHNFAGGFDGSIPGADLFIDGSGVLYGTTEAGGIGGNNGTLFKIVPGHREKVVHAFTGGAGDGAQPSGGVIADRAGNLYGVTQGGGVNGLGVVYKLAPDGTETLVHTFQGICCGIDGSFPIGDLTFDAAGNMYGATTNGGSPADLGSVYEVKADGTELVLHGFAGGADGSTPIGGAVIGKDGSLYGATYTGGASNVGTVYRITSTGAESVLYSFVNNPSDGQYPFGGLLLDKAGNLYGALAQGGSAFGDGALYIITPTQIETLIHSFAGADGALPSSGLIKDKNGNLYGTTYLGGTSNMGTVFKLRTSGELKVLHSFNGSDGNNPQGRLAADIDGNLYGTTQQGGANNLGVVFEITAKTRTAE
ncbi:MAG TPA: choice-of-anchor tandem repeat GloVer-containing protein [Rhizomicrobium sp.]|jgi:uncharacterized repeat protein (TIGR03803 family)|nr:choice-of-anchor tandem repeat GloVer-containing protein [Rhizomicrobium sp.]